MAKNPTNAPKTTPPKVGAAAPKAAQAKPAEAGNDTTGTAAGTTASVTTPATPATPGQDGAAQTAGLNEGQNGPEAHTPEQIQAIKDAAYKEGYSNGFSAALDEQTETDAARDQDLSDGGLGPIDPDLYAEDEHQANRRLLICLALHTPENQRKGGLFIVVNRLQQFIDTLEPEDRYPALQFMAVIAQTSPIDLASGRFKNVVVEAIDSLKGEGIPTATAEENANASEAAMNRMQAAVPDLDNKPENLIDEEGEALPAGVDLMDPDSSAAAAARLAGV